MITKHNDFAQLDHLQTLSSQAISEIVTGGLIQIGSFDTQEVADRTDIVLSPDFYIGWSHPNDIRAKNFKVDWTKYRHKPRSFARIFSKTREGAFALRDGMIQHAIKAGLTPDHAYNWSRIFDPARFALITALVEVQNNPELARYIKTVPLITSNYTQFKNWSFGAPTDNPDFGILDQRSIVTLSDIANKVLRERLTAKECFDMRQDYLEAKAKRTGNPFTRTEFKERVERPEFHDRGHNSKPYQRDGQRSTSTPVKPVSSGDDKFDRFRSSVNSDAPKPAVAAKPQQDKERHTTIISAYPNHEERTRKKQQQQKKKGGERNRKELRWQ